MYTYLVGCWHVGPEGSGPGDWTIATDLPITSEKEVNAARESIRERAGLPETSAVVILAITRLPPGGPYEETQ